MSSDFPMLDICKAKGITQAQCNEFDVCEDCPDENINPLEEIDTCNKVNEVKVELNMKTLICPKCSKLFYKTTLTQDTCKCDTNGLFEVALLWQNRCMKAELKTYSKNKAEIESLQKVLNTIEEFGKTGIIPGEGCWKNDGYRTSALIIKNEIKILQTKESNNG